MAGDVVVGAESGVGREKEKKKKTINDLIPLLCTQPAIHLVYRFIIFDGIDVASNMPV